MSATPDPKRARAIAIVISCALAGAVLWYALAERGTPTNTPVSGNDIAVQTSPRPPVAQVEHVRDDVWNRLRPEARDAVADMLEAQNAAAQDPPSVDLGANGVMTRLPDRYRPVMVSTRVNGERVIDEVMSIPQDNEPAGPAADRGPGQH